MSDYYFKCIDAIPCYFEVVDAANRNGNTREKAIKSNLLNIIATDKYILALDANRRPVDVTVSVIDSGLTKGDKVHFGRAIARTN
jgi:hypothetical protein